MRVCISNLFTNSFKPIFGRLFEVAGRAAGREGEVRDVWDIQTLD